MKASNDSTILSDGKYIYEGWNVVAEYNLSGSTLTRQKVRYWGPDISGSLQGAGGVGGLVATKLEVGTTGTYYTGYDPNGNVTEMFNSTGANVAHYEYDAFGKTINSAGTLAGDFKMRFSTKFWDDETSLYYYGYRYYDPNHGRWLNRDPIGENRGLNLYGFVRNHSVTKWDYLGLIEHAILLVNDKPAPGPSPAVREIAEANKQFGAAAKDFISSRDPGVLNFSENEPWTQALMKKTVCDRMRAELKRMAKAACKKGTTSELMSRVLQWDDSADSYPFYTPAIDGLKYVFGFLGLKSLGSNQGTPAITSINCGSCKLEYTMLVEGEFSFGSGTRYPGTEASAMPDFSGPDLGYLIHR